MWLLNSNGMRDFIETMGGVCTFDPGPCQLVPRYTTIDKTRRNGSPEASA